MSPKELLYIEDALGHIQHFKTKCDDFSGTVTDSNLKSLISRISTEQCALFDKFYSQL